MNLVSYEQIAASSGVSIRTIARDVKRRLLKAYRVGGKALIDADAAAEYIANRKAASALRSQS
jgi:excisionase family DNA binding protein